MSGRRREGLAPTLFPFLAVLVCTLGTLILLLALVAQNAGDAIASSVPDESMPTGAGDEAEAMAEAARLIDMRMREARWARDEAVKMRDAQTADLEERRNRLAHLEDHVSRLRKELELLSLEVESSLDEKGDVLEAQATLDRLIGEIESEKKAIGNLKEALQAQRPRIVIVPHKGPNGTDRRPIYIECRRDGVHLRPGSRRIPLEHLEPKPGFANALDSALRAIRLHALQQYGDQIAPYPLLVVHPDGIETYAIARAAMNNWDDQFGYELVPDGVDLAFPEPDPVLDDKIAAAIRQAVDHRKAMAGFGTGRGGGAGRGYAAGGAHAAGGDFPAGERGPTTGAGGYTGGVNDANRGAAPESGGRGEASGESISGRGHGTPTTAPSAKTSSLPVLSTAQMSRGAASGPLNGQHDIESRLLREARTGGGYDTPEGDPLRGFPASGDAAANESLALNPPSNRSGAGTGSGQRGGDAGQAGTAAGPGKPGGSGLNEPGGEPGGSGSSEDDSSGQTAAAGDATSSGTAAAAGSPAAGSLSSGGASGAGGTQAAGSESPESQQPEAGGMPSVQFSNAPPPLRREGKDWALPPNIASGRGTEMLRMIRVECHSDRFVLLPEGGRGVDQSFSFADGDMNRASLELAGEVRNRAAGWGAALTGARWQPVLEVTIAPGAEDRYRKLVFLLDGSGFQVQPRGTRK